MKTAETPLSLNEDPVERLSRAITEQQLKLHENILYATSDLEYCSNTFEVRNCAVPLAIDSVIAAAGQTLCEDPNAKLELSGKPIDLPTEHLDPANSIKLKALADLINASVGAFPESDLPRYQFSSRGTKGIDVCGEAEDNFIELLNEVANFPENNLQDCQIVVDCKKPIAVRKHRLGVRSVLTLEDTAIDGKPYPAGSLMRLNFLDDLVTSEFGHRFYRDHLDQETRHLIGAEDVVGAHFMRLSRFIGGSVLNEFRHAFSKAVLEYS